MDKHVSLPEAYVSVNILVLRCSSEDNLKSPLLKEALITDV